MSMALSADFVRGQDYVEAVIKAAFPDSKKVQNIVFKTEVVEGQNFKFSADLQIRTSQGDLATSSLKHEEIVQLTIAALRREGYENFNLNFEPESVERASRSIMVSVKLNFNAEVRNPPAS